MRSLGLHYIKIFIVTIVLFMLLPAVMAQPKEQTLREVPARYYAQPLEGRLLLSANFAEARTNHLHSGIDIKVGGVEGAPLYAVADGYIARIGVAPWGFGRVLYISHPNGTMSVYAHQQRFTPAIEEYLDAQRYNLKKHNVDLYPTADRFPVKKGDLIGYAGNSGSSSGPHLHFEIRESSNHKILNVAKLGIYDLKDDIKPTISKIYYIEVDTIQGVAVDGEPRAYALKSDLTGVYSLAAGEVMELGANGYFVIEATDRKNDTHNTMGVYSVRMSLDREPIFTFHLNGHLFSEQRYVNSLTHYKMQRGSRSELLRLAVEPNNLLPIYSNLKNRGAIVIGDEQLHSVTIEVEDDNNNISTLSFDLRKSPKSKPLTQLSDPVGIPLDCSRSFTRSVDGATVSIPAGALYSSILYTQSSDTPVQSKQDRISRIFRVHNSDTPLHTNITISIDNPEAYVPVKNTTMRSKLFIASISGSGKLSYVGGEYSNGEITVTTRSFGNFCVAIDTIPPVITTSFSDGANLSARSSLTFSLSDDLSGVASFSATIDGQWVALEQKGWTLTHVFDPKRITYGGGRHEIQITATDKRGNSTTMKRSFTR